MPPGPARSRGRGVICYTPRQKLGGAAVERLGALVIGLAAGAFSAMLLVKSFRASAWADRLTLLAWGILCLPLSIYPTVFGLEYYLVSYSWGYGVSLLAVWGSVGLLFLGV